MYKYIIVLCCLGSSLMAQQTLTKTYVDSVSYSYFLQSEWNQVIEIGQEALAQSIDFELLHQRMGYAYYAKQMYYAAIKHYQLALKFDADNPISHSYLYYSALYVSNISMARYHAAKLKSLDMKIDLPAQVRPVDAVDVEYNYKINNYDLRGNSHYTRFGFNSLLGYRFALYQSFSTYSQVTDYNNHTRQNEYYVSGSYSLLRSTNFVGAYHYVGTQYNTPTDSLSIPGHLLMAMLSQHLGRFDISLSYSQFTNEFVDVKQKSMQMGVWLPLRTKIYLKSAVHHIADTQSAGFVFGQSIGALISTRLWLQTGVLLGNLNYFSDNNALYLYNSMDPTTFRSAATLFYYPTKNLILFSNYTYDKKQTVDTQFLYNQHSITGGFIWKL